MTFLESPCVGEVYDVITGLSCLENHAEAYTLFGQGLEKKVNGRVQKEFA